jgi:hypothetical protein
MSSLLFNNIYSLIFLSIVSFTLLNCSPTPRMTLIVFDKVNYKPTDPLKLKIYNSRIELPNKYFEIGTIKFEGDIILDEVKIMSASRGAEALILDGNNYILIKFIKPKEQKDEHKVI